jgi:8-oxo-dGTP diphosphatase
MAPAARPQACVSICVVREARALLAQRSRQPLEGLWSLPGGRIEWGETLHEAALRELAEETGVVAEIRMLLDSVDVIRRDSTDRVVDHYVLTTFGAVWRAGEPVAGSDAAAVRWVDADGLDGLTMTPGTAGIVRRGIALLA